MTVPAGVRGKFYALRAVALAVGLAGVAAIVLGTHNFGLRALGLAGVVAGLWLVRRSNSLVWRARGHVVAERSLAGKARRVGTVWWALTAGSLVACVASYFAAYADQMHGGREVWPAYAFFIAALALAATSGYVAMKIFR